VLLLLLGAPVAAAAMPATPERNGRTHPLPNPPDAWLSRDYEKSHQPRGNPWGADPATPTFPLDVWSRNWQQSLTLSPYNDHLLGKAAPWGDWYRIDLLARGYYANDQRIEFTGMEATFGVEAIAAGVLRHRAGAWQLGVEGEFYLNQPFDRNRLVDSPEKRSYVGSFDVSSLEISQFVLSARRGDLLLAIGKMVTPFGRTWFPLYLNDRRDAPFIRTESILWRETGILAQWDPGILVLTAGLMNGSEDRDTNSSKALVARVGLDASRFSLGASVKVQDGVGSEWQKMYNRHAGLDAMWRCGRFTLSGEVIYDEYGARRIGFDPYDITWDHGIYYREQNRAWEVPIHGYGYYANLGYDRPGWGWLLNYGEFYPMSLGDRLHDVTTRRGICKVSSRLLAWCTAYLSVIVENDVPSAQDGKDRRGIFVLGGFQGAW
jgi:hypothetical protein